MSKQPPDDDLHDPDLARRYRESAREEPPQYLDDAILAAARREASARPHALQTEARAAPQYARQASVAASAPSRRGWELPLALAAVLVLSVSIVVLSPEVPQQPKPDEPQARAPQSLADAPSDRDPAQAPAARLPHPSTSERAVPRSTAPARQRHETSRDQETPQARAAAKAQKSEEDAAHADRLEAGTEPERPFRAEAETRAAGSAAAPARQRADESPEKWGEKIVDLRRQGRAAEADRLLAEFRRRFPDYVVPSEWTR